MMEWINANWWLVGGCIVIVLGLLYNKGYFTGVAHTLVDPTISPEIAMYRNVKRVVTKSNEKDAASELMALLKSFKQNPDEIRIKVTDANPKA